MKFDLLGMDEEYYLHLRDSTPPPQYRVSHEIGRRDSPHAELIEETFVEWDKALYHYKRCLTRLYRSHQLPAWRICINRIRHDTWERPLHYEEHED